MYACLYVVAVTPISSAECMPTSVCVFHVRASTAESSVIRFWLARPSYKNRYQL